MREDDPLIDYHIIHCKNHIDEITKRERTSNIEQIYNRIFGDVIVTIFDAIDGNIFSAITPLQQIVKSYDSQLYVSYENHLTNCEIGCYLSHYLLVKSCVCSANEFSVILEDDAQILSEDLHSEVLFLLREIDIDFDILFLGNLNHHKGPHYKENIYFLDAVAPCWGTHSLLINNKTRQKYAKN